MRLADSFIYLSRYVLWNYSNTDDYRRFSSSSVETGDCNFAFRQDAEKQAHTQDLFRKISYSYRNERITSSLDDLLVSTETTAFIVIQNDTILWEKYYNGTQRNSLNTSFSIAKSFTSALVGIAIADGFIRDVKTPVIHFLPELNGKISPELSIEHLLMMNSGIKYNPRYFPWADEPLSYYYPNLQDLLFRKVRQGYIPGESFTYANYNTILLGIILERATGKSPARLLEEKIWKPLGMEFPASWNMDSRKHGLTKMESGINARSIDFARFGRLFLHSGNWNGQQLIPEAWVNASTSPTVTGDPDYYLRRNYAPYFRFFADKRLYYKYGWWGLKHDDTHYDFIGIGFLGQFVYVCPQKQLIIVRNGNQWGKINWWPGLFFELEKLL